MPRYDVHGITPWTVPDVDADNEVDAWRAAINDYPFTDGASAPQMVDVVLSDEDEARSCI